MIFPFKAIFVDLDGTLLNSKKMISKENYTCLNRFIDAGIHVVVATGRTIKSVRKVTTTLNLKAPVITLNGNDIRSTVDGYSLKISYMENQLRDKIFQSFPMQIEKFKIQNILVDTGDYFYVYNPHMLDMEEFTSHYDNPPRNLDFHNLPNESVVSILFLLADESKKTEFLAAQKKILGEEVKVCTFNGWPWIEVGCPHSNKGAAMEFVCEQLSISCKDVIAFGDGENDVEMLKMAGLGVAMANADEHALKAADTQTKHHNEDGVSYYLNFLLQNKDNQERILEYATS